MLPGPRYGGLLLGIILWTPETEETGDEDSGKRPLVVEDSTVVLFSQADGSLVNRKEEYIRVVRW